MMNIVALAGGVGGAKLADGLFQLQGEFHLTVVVNTGDDFEYWGLWICPDLDTVSYTLAGIANSETGWGLSGESWQALHAVQQLGGADWFHVGDRDLGTHLERTRRLHAGEPLSGVTRAFCQAWGVAVDVLPMSDQRVSTYVQTTRGGELAFQEYFVHQQCIPAVCGFRFEGIEQARPAPGVLEAIRAADLIVLCPSNPWVSLGPILGISGIREALLQRVVVAVSPIVGGKAIKGPAAKMYRELGFIPSAEVVAGHYGALLSGMVLDREDAEQAENIQKMGVVPCVTQTVMQNRAHRKELAATVVQFGQSLSRR